LSLGSQTKNTVCFAKGEFAYISTVHPDLNNPKDLSIFEKTVKYFLKKNPKIITYDLHPEYQTTKYALQLHATRYTLYATQHHHAHIASCMIENGLKNQKVIGVAFDGTGLGANNTLWGAEFLLCDYRDFKRMAHLREVPLLGGENAILEPWRLAAIWLYFIFKENFLNLDLGLVRKMDKQKWRILKSMYLSGVNAPLASSMGRLFDAVAGLVLDIKKVRFEAELAIELEKLATGFRHKDWRIRQEVWRNRLQATGYNFKIIKKDDGYILDPSLMFKEIIKDLQGKGAKEKIAYRFHLSVAEMIKMMCKALKKKTKINTVILSGGVFQNKILLSLSLDLLSEEKFRIYYHKRLPCSDASLSLGQVAIANYKTP